MGLEASPEVAPPPSDSQATLATLPADEQAPAPGSSAAAPFNGVSAPAREFSVDIGNLCVVDSAPIAPDAQEALLGNSTTATDEQCLALGTAAVQHLVAQLFALPSTATKMGRLVTLPAPTTPLPREKPLPKPRPPTKWEKFAQAKGIVKRKRSKLVFEEGSEEWKRRYGYKRAKDENEIPILEAKATDEVGVDAFGQLRQKRKERVKKQEKNRLANLKQAAKAMKGSAAPSTALPSALAISASALPLTSTPLPRKISKTEISEAASLTRTATASLGKFDPKLKGAKPAKKAPKSTKILPVAEPRVDKKGRKWGQGGGGAVVGMEKQLMSSLADAVIARNDTGQSMDVGKAISMLNKKENGRVLGTKDSKSKSGKGMKRRSKEGQGPKGKTKKAKA